MGRPRKPTRSPVLEWISAAVGLVVTLSLIGLLVREAIGSRDGVPILEAIPVSVTEAGDVYFVELEVHNRSHSTGAGVQVEGTLKAGGAEVESSTTTVSFVPGRSKRGAGLVFTRDPRRYTVQIRVTGYEQP